MIAEDAWLDTLFGDEMTTGSDYLMFSGRLREVVGPHVTALLRAGVSVALDFQANTVASRTWMRGIIDAAGCAHQMHVLIPPDAVCLQRLHARNSQGDHPFAATEAQFHRFARHFVLPGANEGFEITTYTDPL